MARVQPAPARNAARSLSCAREAAAGAGIVAKPSGIDTEGAAATSEILDVALAAGSTRGLGAVLASMRRSGLTGRSSSTVIEERSGPLVERSAARGQASHSRTAACSTSESAVTHTSRRCLERLIPHPNPRLQDCPLSCVRSGAAPRRRSGPCTGNDEGRGLPAPPLTSAPRKRALTPPAGSRPAWPSWRQSWTTRPRRRATDPWSRPWSIRSPGPQRSWRARRPTAATAARAAGFP